MRALSLFTPWASAVAAGVKRIENRSWPPPNSLIGNQLAIHAGLRHDKAAEHSMREGAFSKLLPIPYAEMRHARGAIVAVAKVTSCVYGFRELVDDELARRGMLDQAPWFFGPYGWLLNDVRQLKEPVPCRGFQRLWGLPTEIEERVLAQL